MAEQREDIANARFLVDREFAAIEDRVHALIQHVETAESDLAELQDELADAFRKKSAYQVIKDALDYADQSPILVSTGPARSSG